MASSHQHQLSDILELIIRTNPDTLLDVGIGFGKYGFLAREYLELWGTNDYRKWTKRIDGVEAFKEYLTPVHNYIYDNIYIGNALEILPELKSKYDLILLIDVLEHFEYEEGRELIQLCLQKGRNLIISTPKDIGSQ